MKNIREIGNLQQKIKSLKKKYGATEADVLEYLGKIKEEYAKREGKEKC